MRLWGKGKNPLLSASNMFSLVVQDKVSYILWNW